MELLYHVRQQTEKARALDRLRELTLLLGRHSGDPARHDLAALGDVALQQLHVLVVDFRRIRAGKRAALAATEEGAAAALCLECHGLFLPLGNGGLVAVTAAGPIFASWPAVVAATALAALLAVA